ncbi:MAG TPA: type II toxin-antitoxin system RelE/ParE family toxin [Puia sp.]
MKTDKCRQIYFYKKSFEEFFTRQGEKVKEKIIWTLRLIEELPQVPESYLKHLTGLYEIRVQASNGIFRIFCFFDQSKLIVLLNGFQKKTQKTPGKENSESAQNEKRVL